MYNLDNLISIEYRSDDVTKMISCDVMGLTDIFNLVPRVLSLPRESTLVTAGHVSA